MTYIHGTSQREQDRLALMNGLLNERGLALLAPRGDERCLELGAGTGVFARALAEALTEGGSVLGIERDHAQLARARTEPLPENLELRQGDATAPPLAPGEVGSFDLAHARFLLEHVPTPLDVVRAMARAVRPGGRVVLVDDDHTLLRFWPEPPGVVALWDVYWRAFGGQGTDPNVGRKLVSLLVEAGLRPTRTEQQFYGGCAGEPHFAGLIENFELVMRSATDLLLATGALDAPGFEAALAALRTWARRDDAVLWYALPWAEGVRPEA